MASNINYKYAEYAESGYRSDEPIEYADSGYHPDEHTEYMDSCEDNFSEDKSYAPQASAAVNTLIPRSVMLQRVNRAAEEAKAAVKEKKKQQEAIEITEITEIREKLNWLENKKVNTTVINDNKDFPTLSTAPKPVVYKQTLSTAPKPVAYKQTLSTNKDKNNKGVNITKFVMSYKEEIRSTNYTDQRANAFEILSDKEGLEKKLIKTRMCDSVVKGGKCRHGDKCRFAHNLDELNISSCLFGDNCRFQKKCSHKHPQESKDEFLTRTGLDRYKLVVEKPVVEKPVVEKPVVEKPVVEKPVVEVKPKFSTPQLEKIEAEHKVKAECVVQEMKGTWATKFKPTQVIPDSVKPSPPLALHAEETVLRVPRELAMQAIELAMKCGKNCIRVEIV